MTFDTARVERSTPPAADRAVRGVLQRCGDHPCPAIGCVGDDERSTLQRAAVTEAPVTDVPPIVHEVLRSQGAPLDAQTRAYMEPRFGQDFSGVRVHTDEKAVRSAAAVQALAYTVGRDIVFAPGQYAPRTDAGRRTLAHELAHVVQQRRLGSGEAASQRLHRLVEERKVSCASYPRSFPIFTALGTADPVGVIRAADARGEEILNNIIAELTGIRTRVIGGEAPNWPMITDALAESMRTRLRLDASSAAVWTGRGPGSVEIIIRWYTNIRNTLASGGVRYTCLDPDCSGTRWAAAVPGASRIYLCRPFWRASLDDEALTLIHETSHIYYDTDDTGGGAGNASCLEQFAADLNNIPVLPAFIRACTPP